MDMPRVITPEYVLEFVAKAREMKQQMLASGQPEPVLVMPTGERVGLFDADNDEVLDDMETLALWQLGRISSKDAKPVLDRMCDLPPREAQRILGQIRATMRCGEDC